MEAVLPFLGAGLSSDEYCLWITNALISVPEAIHALESRIDQFEKFWKRGQVEVLSAKEWYGKGSGLDRQKSIDKVRKKVEAASKNKWEGLRGVGGVHQIPSHQWKSILDHETSIHEVFRQFPMIGVCAYSLPNCPLQNISKVIDGHDKTFLKKGCNWEVVS